MIKITPVKHSQLCMVAVFGSWTVLGARRDRRNRAPFKAATWTLASPGIGATFGR